MNSINTTNKLLLIIVIILLLYVVKVLAFIFVPLMLSIFITFLFSPWMRWLVRHKIPNPVALFMVCLVVVGFFYGLTAIVQVSINEIAGGRQVLFEKLDDRLGQALAPYATVLELEAVNGKVSIKEVLNSKPVNNFIIKNLGPSFTIVQKTSSIILMTIFFVLLLLAGSVKMDEVLDKTLFNDKRRTWFTYLTIERSIGRFIAVKTLMSFGTGLFFGLACWFFDVSFPVFWGFFTFLINYVQFAGSVISTTILGFYSIVEIEETQPLLAFIAVIILIQVFWGSLVEPILLGRSFSINVISVLVMLMLWGYLLGIPGLILAIPITVFIKTLMMQFPKTKRIADLIS